MSVYRYNIFRQLTFFNSSKLMDMIRNSLLTAAIFICFSSFLQGQELLTVEYLESRSQTELEAQLDIDIRNGVDFYRVTYLTLGSDGQPDTASGLFVIPDSDLEAYPAVVYHRGTTSAPNIVPSNLNTDFDAYAGIGASGYMTIAPDFLGMGTSRGFHPYVHRETQASASIDLLRAFRQWIETQQLEWNGQLFLTGYSQGGHSSMATHWELEANLGAEFEVTAATHLSGPYSISQVMLDNMFAEEDYLFVGYIPYVLLGYQEVYGDLYDDLSEILRPQFVGDAMAFYNGEIDLVALNIRMVISMGTSFFNLHPVNLFQPAFVDSMRNNPDYHINQILRENDTYDWAPEAPLRIMYCMADDQVPFENSILADSVMRANGAADLETIDLNPNFDHGQCARPALIETIAFFDSFTQTSTEEEIAFDSAPSVFPNPATDHLSISGLGDGVFERVNIYNMSGQVVLSATNHQSIDISDLIPGIYALRITADGTTYSKTLSVNR